jgi:hypothetical protein
MTNEGVDLSFLDRRGARAFQKELLCYGSLTWKSFSDRTGLQLSG